MWEVTKQVLLHPKYRCVSVVKQVFARNILNYNYEFSNINTDAHPQDDPKANRKLIESKLVELLKIKPIKALEIVASNKKFSSGDLCTILSNYEICKNSGIQKSAILNCPTVLLEPKLPEKMEKIKLLALEPNSAISFHKFSLLKLDLFILNKSELLLRVQDLCSIFNVPENKAFEILATKPFLLTISKSHIHENLKLFQDFGFSNEELLKDLWIFRYSADFILARCEMIRKYKIVNIRTWMIRCPEETLLKHIRREMENKDILGEYSVTEYLSNKLECSENVAKYLITKHPQLQTRSILKLRETIDFLYKHGFTSTHICRVSKILLHSKKTTEKRIKSLATLGVKSVSLYILTKSQKQYEEHIDNLLKSK